MANEAVVQCGLRIKKGYLDFQGQPASHRVTVTGTKGPTPGAITVGVLGTFLDLSQLATPGLCHIINLDTSNYVSFGTYDGAAFHYLMELKAGEAYTFRLSRHLGDETAGTGTGTPGDVNRVMLVANTAPCNVIVSAFED